MTLKELKNYLAGQTGAPPHSSSLYLVDGKNEIRIEKEEKSVAEGGLTNGSVLRVDATRPYSS